MLRTLVLALGLLASAQAQERGEQSHMEKGTEGPESGPMHEMGEDGEHPSEMLASSLMGMDPDEYFGAFEKDFTQAKNVYYCRSNDDCHSGGSGRGNRRFLDGREGGRDGGKDGGSESGKEGDSERGREGPEGDDERGEKGEGREGEEGYHNENDWEEDEEDRVVCGYLRRESYEEGGEEGDRRGLRESEDSENVCMPREFCDEEFRSQSSSFNSHCGGMSIARAKMGSVMFFLVIILILVIVALTIGIVYLKMQSTKTVPTEQISEGQELSRNIPATGQPVHLVEESEATPYKGTAHALPNTTDKLNEYQ